MMWSTFQDCSSGEPVLNVLSEFLKNKASGSKDSVHTEAQSDSEILV